MKKAAIVAGLAGLLLFSGTALAEDAHSHNMTNEEHQNMTGKTDQHSTMTADEHANMSEDEHANMSEDEHTNMSSDEHTNMSSDEHSSHSSGTDAATHEEPASGGHGSHGSNENVVETPPNVPVLATFGAINAAFILFGIWNKWLRKKEALV